MSPTDQNRSEYDRWLRQAERDLVAALRVELRLHRVLVFGSFVRRDMHECSDLDLLLIGDFDQPTRLRERAVRELAWRLGLTIPIEVIACTPEEFERARSRPFLSHILTEAREEVPLPTSPRSAQPVDHE